MTLRIIFLLAAVMYANLLFAKPIEYRIPVGAKDFCENNPSECLASPAATIKLDKRTIKIISNVNTTVNREVTPKVDVGEQWNMFVTSGDCEDYALTKRAKLRSLGFPAGALRMATGWLDKEKQSYHAVLVLITTGGELVLDNLTNDIIPATDKSMIFDLIATTDMHKWIKYEAVRQH